MNNLTEYLNKRRDKHIKPKSEPILEIPQSTLNIIEEYANSDTYVTIHTTSKLDTGDVSKCSTKIPSSTLLKNLSNLHLILFELVDGVYGDTIKEIKIHKVGDTDC